MREGGEGREEGSRAGVADREAMGFLTAILPCLAWMHS